MVGACSSVRLERTPDKREVGGSIPPRPTTLCIKFGGLAQLGERLPCTQEVSGSIPLSSTKLVLFRRTEKALLGLFFCSDLQAILVW